MADKKWKKVAAGGGGGGKLSRNSSGGSDGCINFNDPDNKGLKKCILETNIPRIYQEVCDKISLADFLVIAAEAMMARAGKTYNAASPFAEGSLEAGFMKKFYYGRKTNVECEEVGLMPNPEKGCEDVNQILNKHIFYRPSGDKGGKGHTYWNKRSWRDSMTLMGVHSVGRARKENSGYEGPWTSTPGVFDNSYYTA